MSHRHRALLILTIAVFSLLCSAGLADAAQPYVWLEGEKPASADFEWKAAGGDPSSVLSGGKYLLRAAGAVPEKGCNLSYELDVPEAGKYALWLRVGFVRLRSDVTWRIDQGPWRSAGKPQARSIKAQEKRQRDRFTCTVNDKEIGHWAQVGWWDVGQAELAAGKHVLQLRFISGLSAKPIVALDAVCLVKGKWTPEGSLHPGGKYDSDTDRKAAAHTFALPEAPAGGARAKVVLTGPWQIARYDDPDMDKDTYKPVDRLPSAQEYPLRWMGVDVPSSPWDHPELVFGHRLIYRTRVSVPASHAGRAFRLHFSGTNWIVSVFINGKPAGTHKGVWIPWDLDVSQFVEPGKVNELVVAVKGSWYAFDGEHHSATPQENRCRPFDATQGRYWVAPMNPSTKGDGDGRHYGIVNPVTLVSAGSAYTADVFIKPSVERKSLAAEVTVRNTTGRARAVTVACDAVNDKTGQVEKTFARVELRVPPNATAVANLGGPWAEAKLWWPVPNPNLYRLRTRVSDGGDVVDVQEELFGFREVTIRGPGIYINGVRRNFWNWSSVARAYFAKPEEWAQTFRAENNRFARFSHNRRIRQVLPTREQRLEFFDRNGIPGRLCSMIDGMFHSFYLGDRFREKDTMPLRMVPHERVWENFREHIAQLTKAYRNHPSVLMYQIENELVYINGMNRFSTDKMLDDVEREMMKVYLAGYANDPTRPYTVGGGGDLSHATGMDRSLEINSPHYPQAALDYYPEDAYHLTHYSTKITRWPWTLKKPWVVGESMHASELRLGSYVAGPLAYRSKDDVDRAKAKFLRMFYGGYRWTGVAGFFPWCNLDRYADARKVFSDLVAIPRKQTWRLYGGRESRLLYKVMNDTLSAAPVTFEWS